MQFATPIAYKLGSLSLGVSPILHYGSLDIYYKHPNPSIGIVTAGASQDFGVGVSFGLTYEFTNRLTVRIVYKSKIKMVYDRVLSNATSPFREISNFPDIGDRLKQPQEIGVGISYSRGSHSIALDFKKIFWSKAKGYREFGWREQKVFALGYQYQQDKWAIRFGFNYGKSPLTIFTGKDRDMTGAALNMFNLLGFPATAKSHFTTGGSYRFNKNLSGDFAIVYSPKNRIETDISALGVAQKIANSHKELGLTLQLNYSF